MLRIWKTQPGMGLDAVGCLEGLIQFMIIEHSPKPPSGDLKGCSSKMAPRNLKPRSRKIRENFCEDLLPRKLAKETFKAQNPGSSLFRPFPRMYIWIHTIEMIHKFPLM